MGPFYLTEVHDESDPISSLWKWATDPEGPRTAYQQRDLDWPFRRRSSDRDSEVIFDPLYWTAWRAILWGPELKPGDKCTFYTFRKRLLERAIKHEQLVMLRILLKLDADFLVDINRERLSVDNKRYIHFADCCKDPAILHALMEEGADLNVGTIFGHTPLHVAYERDYCPTIMAILGYDFFDLPAGDSLQGHSLQFFRSGNDWSEINNHTNEWPIRRTATELKAALGVCKAFVPARCSAEIKDNGFLDKVE
ncbi:hypothetical protein BJ875DRAFT_545602 [Amylocarpus encephaloides]|uniref:Ankyrin repeat protein n=1 Tax=Amylocarpus encephaloides TaxID=45428 RepID=A0A9P7YCE0_9HELO|nr:hypothetical protein BJ875DRAFT_545602 [Amylocarpus encephaloides]